MSINNVFLVGRLGAAPERRVTQTGKSLCTMSIATDHWDKSQSAKVAEWHRVVVWDQAADNCMKYLDKGSQVAVEGRINTRRYDGDDGKPKYWTEVLARRVTFLGGGPRNGGSATAAPSGGARAMADDIPF
jgi:single-strand DNA-binding protein